MLNNPYQCFCANMNPVHFQSDNQDWATPQKLFDKLNDEFHFTLDVCALPENAKCNRLFSPKDDGLSKYWSGVCWMNPPYGAEIAKWMQKALQESARGVTVVCLVPARTDTEWWHKWAVQGEIRYLCLNSGFKWKLSGRFCVSLPR